MMTSKRFSSGVTEKKSPAGERLIPELGQNLAAADEGANIARGDLLQQRHIEGKHSDANRAAIHVPAVHLPKERQERLPGDGATAVLATPVFAQALERSDEEHAGAARGVKEPPSALTRSGSISQTCDTTVSAKNMGV